MIPPWLHKDESFVNKVELLLWGSFLSWSHFPYIFEKQAGKYSLGISSSSHCNQAFFFEYLGAWYELKAGFHLLLSRRIVIRKKNGAMPIIAILRKSYSDVAYNTENMVVWVARRRRVYSKNLRVRRVTWFFRTCLA